MGGKDSALFLFFTLDTPTTGKAFASVLIRGYEMWQWTATKCQSRPPFFRYDKL